MWRICCSRPRLVGKVALMPESCPEPDPADCDDTYFGRFRKEIETYLPNRS
jgi:hypothetical protein